MLPAANDPAGTPGEVLENAQERAGAAYVRERLREEQIAYNESHKGRGYQAHIVRELLAQVKHKLAKPHLANIINGHAQAGLRQQVAFARFWGMTLDELQAKGKALAPESGPVLSSDLTTLEAHLVAALTLVRAIMGTGGVDEAEIVRDGIAAAQVPSAASRKKAEAD
jgi:hypothetical protein